MTETIPHPFPTLVVGSLPRPEWIRELIEDRKAGHIDATEADRLLNEAIPSNLKMQERAGLDYVSDGEWRRESYMKVFSEAVSGFENDTVSAGASNFPQLRYPSVVSEMKAHRFMAVDEVRFVREHTDRRILAAIPSAYTLGRRMWDPRYSTGAYPTREAFMHACIPFLRREIRKLTACGVDAIQLDDPWLALLVDPDYREREGIVDIEQEISLCVDCFNATVRGFEEAFISVHLCHAHFNRAHSTRGPYHLIMDALGEMNADRIAMEFATPDAGGVESLRRFPPDKLLGLGAIDHTDRHVETPEEVVERVERALEFVPPERDHPEPRLWIRPVQPQSHGPGRGLPEAQGHVRWGSDSAREIRLIPPARIEKVNDLERRDEIRNICRGDVRQLARTLTEVENSPTESTRNLLKALFRKTGGSWVMGITGSPGAGKSTLVEVLARHYRKAGEKVGSWPWTRLRPFRGEPCWAIGFGCRICLPTRESSSAAWPRGAVWGGSPAPWTTPSWCWPPAASRG